MANKNGGFIGTDGLDAPDPPTAVTPTGGNASVSVAFTAPTDTGTSAITGFVAQVSTDGTDYSGGSGTGTSSPITVSSLTNGTAYTAKVWAINAYGTSAPSDASDSFSPVLPRGLIFGGRTGSTSLNNVDAITIGTSGNATDFGDLQTASAACSSAASGTRGIKFGGRHTSGGGSNKSTNEIDYFTISSTGNATDFGDLPENMNQAMGLSNDVRGVNMGGSGETTNGGRDEYEYITIASTGNTTDFGDSTSSYLNQGGATASTTRGVVWTGESDDEKTIEYITIASTGNATDFGDATQDRPHTCCSASNTRALAFAGQGGSTNNSIEYITIASTGNASDFGDPDTNRDFGGSFSSKDNYAYLCGGNNPSSGANLNEIEYVTIASTGNGTDFGNLTAAKDQTAGCSNVHGGL